MMVEGPALPILARSGTVPEKIGGNRGTLEN